MFWYSSMTVHKINNRSNAVKLILTLADIDQDVLLTPPSHACRRLQLPSCQAVITKALHWAERELKNMEDIRGAQDAFVLNFDTVFILTALLIFR